MEIRLRITILNYLAIGSYRFSVPLGSIHLLVYFYYLAYSIADLKIFSEEPLTHLDYFSRFLLTPLDFLG